MSKKNDKALSRRDFLFAGLRRLRHDDDEGEKKQEFSTLAAATEGVTKDDATKAKEAFVAGNAAYAKADYDTAWPLYRECVQLFPAHLEARKRLAYCHYRMGRHLQAKVEFERVLREAKKDNFSFLYLGLTYCHLEKPDKAVKAWKGYFNTEEVRIMRELNVQMAMLGSVEPPDPKDVADLVEEAIQARKEELLDQEAKT
ncbi:MAG: tetratricopeptide repeat protein [Proteobacteria bacterium]|nr:tetratricopeptide repeat protein [Pseudomonadota bacterium]